MRRPWTGQPENPPASGPRARREPAPSASARRGTRTPDASARLGLARRGPGAPWTWHRQVALVREGIARAQPRCGQASRRAMGVPPARAKPRAWGRVGTAGRPCPGGCPLVRYAQEAAPARFRCAHPFRPGGPPWTKSLGEERMPTAVAAARRSARGGAGRVGGMGDRPRGSARLLHGMCRPGRGTGRLVARGRDAQARGRAMGPRACRRTGRSGRRAAGARRRTGAAGGRARPGGGSGTRTGAGCGAAACLRTRDGRAAVGAGCGGGPGGGGLWRRPRGVRLRAWPAPRRCGRGSSPCPGSPGTRRAADPPCGR
ncbi:hypothetical protein SUDANB99_04392 [Streptomyces sp. enrichment culture]